MFKFRSNSSNRTGFQKSTSIFVGDCRSIRKLHLPQDCHLISAAIGPSGRWGRSISRTACSPPCGYFGWVPVPVPPRSGSLASLLPLPCPLKQNTNKYPTGWNCSKTGSWAGWWRPNRGLHKLHNLYFSPNIRVMKSGRVRLAKHTACV